MSVIRYLGRVILDKNKLCKFWVTKDIKVLDQCIRMKIYYTDEVRFGNITHSILSHFPLTTLVSEDE